MMAAALRPDRLVPWRKCWFQKGIHMNASKLIGILLIAGGAIGLVVGSFSYTKETQAVKLGPLELSVQEKETINVPVWAGLGAIALGAALLVLGGRKG
jgi:hypothetical protein